MTTSPRFFAVLAASLLACASEPEGGLGTLDVRDDSGALLEMHLAVLSPRPLEQAECRAHGLSGDACAEARLLRADLNDDRSISILACRPLTDAWKIDEGACAVELSDGSRTWSSREVTMEYSPGDEQDVFGFEATLVSEESDLVLGVSGLVVFGPTPAESIDYETVGPGLPPG